ncbi:hypothetical protein KSP40_PGU015983 [Platanthera guangdongensis]|uniref:Uncharacterized protein n=1 Tax=Platanthera guangdongensis TaxID=2320717 RepID=A0ABR2LIQ0_9ASPA
MAVFTNLSRFLGKKKKNFMKSLKAADCKACCVDVELRARPIKLSGTSTVHESNLKASKSFPTMQKSSSFTPNTAGMDNLVIAEFEGDAGYEGGNEHGEILPMKRDYSDFNLQEKVELVPHGSDTNSSNCVLENNIETNEVAGGHEGDTRMEQTPFWASPGCKQSNKSSSYGDHKSFSGNDSEEFNYEDQSMPLSIKTSSSADCLIHQKHSSCQVLCSGSKNNCWNLCLWSDGNLDMPSAGRLALVHSTDYDKVGYSSDTHELVEEHDEKKAMEIENQWVAFPLPYSPHDRVYSWINSLEEWTFCPIDDKETFAGKEDRYIACPDHMEMGESSGKYHSHITPRAAEEMIQANNVIQCLNSSTSVAHFAGIGLKVIPCISAFGSLRSVSLTRNFIAHITPGCLPKNIHTLDLSRNKLSTIEGLRDLTKLRVLNLSYNRISRIGHGLSSCTGIKELYAAGNRISHVEGLHRFLKLTILDLSFNNITTVAAFGQLVANYNSLFALNLLGNPIQSNLGDDLIRKAVMSLLPRIGYFNKQLVKQHRAREVAANCAANAAIGDGGWSSRSRPTRRSALGLGSSTKSMSGRQSRSRHQHSSSARK